MVKEKNRCMNFVKGICCIAIILMHCSFPNKIGNLITYPFKIAVPFFFMISGYFAYHNDNNKLFCKTIHILKLLLTSEMIYTIYYLVFDQIQLMNHFSGGLRQLFKIIFVGTLSTNNALWFLYALFWSYVCLIFISKFKLYKIFHIISIVILVLHVIVRSFVKDCSWYEDSIFRNFLFFGLPFVLFGSFIKSKENMLLKKVSNKICIIGALFGEFVMVIEYFILDASDYYIGNIITIFFVFAIKNPKLYINKILEFIGDKLSMYVYIFHMLGLYIINLLANLLNISNNLLFRWARPILVIIVTLSFSYLIYLIMNKIGDKKLLNRS